VDVKGICIMRVVIGDIVRDREEKSVLGTMTLRSIR
jgi:hypothetical protein